MKELCSDMGQKTSGLLERCAAGDEQAWREMFLLYHPVVVRFLRRMGLPPIDAADAAQDVFVQVHRYLGRFEQRSDIKTWLYKLCLSRASRHHRARKMQSAFDLLFRRSRVELPRPGELLDSEVQRVVTGAIGQLKRIHREVFVLFEIEGLAGEEIARVLDCPVATIRRRLHYARKELAAILDCPEPTEGKHESDR